jgi:hypothetical protein
MNTLIKIAFLAKRSLIVMAIAFALAIGLYFSLDIYKTELTSEVTRLLQAEGTGKTAWSKKQADLKNLKAHMNEYNKLSTEGLIGVADRSGWVEQLVLSRDSLDLPDTLTYTLQSPKPYTAKNGPAAKSVPGGSDAEAIGAPQFHDLVFSIKGIHEEELLAFLHDYRAKVKGRFRVNTCTLSDRTAEGLSADCTLRFFTLQKSSS